MTALNVPTIEGRHFVLAVEDLQNITTAPVNPPALGTGVYELPLVELMDKAGVRLERPHLLTGYVAFEGTVPTSVKIWCSTSRKAGKANAADKSPDLWGEGRAWTVYPLTDEQDERGGNKLRVAVEEAPLLYFRCAIEGGAEDTKVHLYLMALAERGGGIS